MFPRLPVVTLSCLIAMNVVGSSTITAEPNTPAAVRTDHWSFQPLGDAPPPASDSDWTGNPIDAFVLAKLESAGLAHAAPAHRVEWMRRLYLDVLGLPPTPEAIDAFVADTHPYADERLVDSVLESPRYGERWATHWLDVTRFAESHGNETNRIRLTAYHYRDYVIDAFNEDKPYDQFIFEQLAGDTVGLDAPTAFLVGGAWDGVTSPDINVTLMQRQDELADIINTTGTAFLGLTLGCARCHDHKYDPVPQEDYYAFQGVFAGVRHGERKLRMQASTSRREERLQSVQLRRAAINEELKSLGVRETINGRQNTEVFEPVIAKRVRFTILKTIDDKEAIVDEVEVFAAEDGSSVETSAPPINVALASMGGVVRTSGDLKDDPTYHSKHLIDGEYGIEHGWMAGRRGEVWIEVELAKPTRIDRVVWSRDRLKGRRSRLAVRYHFEVAGERGDDWRVVANSDRFLRSVSVAEKKRAERLLIEKQSLAIRSLQIERDTVYAGLFEEPDPVRLLRRGNPRSPQDVIPPGALSALPALALDSASPERERRVALARWMVTAGRALTARVLVNRVWHYHFGTGIVDTPSDFGGNGSLPTHPKLLDWLASEFIRSGWSIKHVHRLILCSSTYRQSSQPNERGVEVDADSRLLWRFPPRRLEAEAIRDSVLSVSGSLRTEMRGPGFDLFRIDRTYSRVTYQPIDFFGPEEWRRMVYGTKIRMVKEAVFGAFDSPDAGQVCPKRTRSTTPIQALSLFNSPFVIEQAERFADRVVREAGQGIEAQVERAFRLAFGRRPDDREAEDGADLVEEHGLATLCRVLHNGNEFLFLP